MGFFDRELRKYNVGLSLKVKGFLGIMPKQAETEVIEKLLEDKHNVIDAGAFDG